jgi:hypothetical protein
MADGIRIRPQRARLAVEGVTDVAGRLFIVRDWARPIPPSPHNPECRTCGRPHECKTYHLLMDSEGTTIVSTGIWDRFLRMPDHGGFELANVVSSPPAQGIVLPPASVSVTVKEF